MYKTIINENGFIMDICVLIIDDKPFNYELKDGESPVEYYNGTDYIKPRWDFGLQEWVEGATEEEIKAREEANKIDNSTELTNEERITKLEEEKSILAENVYQLASIIEVMLGGNESGQTETITTDTSN